MILDPLSGVATSFLQGSATIAERGDRFLAWQRERERYGLWPATLAGRDDAPPPLSFTGRDALALAAEPGVIAMALEALERCGRGDRAAGTTMVEALQASLAHLLRMCEAVCFVSGSAAVSGTVASLVGRGDTVILDDGAGPALRHAAAASGARVVRAAVGDTAGLAMLLRDARERAPRAAVLAAIETLSITRPGLPDIAAWRAACDREGATLLVDATHDLGAAGPGGTGVLGMQAALALPDIVVGSLGRAFAAAGGFAAFSSPAVAALVRVLAPLRAAAGPIPPWCAAAAHAAMQIAVGAEGEMRRAELACCARRLRAALKDLAAPGPDGAVMLVPTGGEAVSRRALRHLTRDRLAVELLEPPLVARGHGALRLRLSIRHGGAEIDRAALAIRDALAKAQRERELHLPDPVPPPCSPPRLRLVT